MTRPKLSKFVEDLEREDDDFPDIINIDTESLEEYLAHQDKEDMGAKKDRRSARRERT